MNELVPQEPQLSKANTIGNRVQEFLDAELMHAAVRTKADFRCALVEFVQYLIYCNGVIKPETISGFALHLQRKGSKPPSIKKKTLYLKRFLKWCHRMGYTEQKWYHHIQTIRVPALPMPRIIRHEEYLNIRKSCSDIHREWIVVLAYNTGMRMGDCCSMRWSHVDQERQVITKVQNKNLWKSSQPVEIPYESGSDLHMLLMKMWAMKDDIVMSEKDNYVCPVMWLSYDNSKSAVSNSFRWAFNKAGCPDLSFKNFRSTFESRLANSGMNLALAARITGRSDPRVLMRYVRPDMDAAREGIAKAMHLHDHIKGFA
jgi:integrase